MPGIVNKKTNAGDSGRQQVCNAEILPESCAEYVKRKFDTQTNEDDTTGMGEEK